MIKKIESLYFSDSFSALDAYSSEFDLFKAMGIRHREEFNIKQHGITFEQASYVFADPFALSRYDDEHSEDEDRWILLGKSLSETIIVVFHTFRDNDGVEYVRIISARRATRKEKQAYKKRRPV